MSRDEDDRQLMGCLQGFEIMLMGLFFLTMVMLFILEPVVGAGALLMASLLVIGRHLGIKASLARRQRWTRLFMPLKMCVN